MYTIKARMDVDEYWRVLVCALKCSYEQIQVLERHFKKTYRYVRVEEVLV